MNLFSVLSCSMLLGIMTSGTAHSVEDVRLFRYKNEKSSEGQSHSMRKRNADPFFHLLFGFGKNRNRRPKHHKEVHLHVLHPPKFHNEIHHGGQDHFDYEPPSWFEADEYGNPHQEGHFDFEGFGPWNGDSSHGKPHQTSHDQNPHFGQPYSTFETSHEITHLPPIHIDQHEGHLHLPPKRPPRLHDQFHPSPHIDEVIFVPMNGHNLHDFHPLPPVPIELPPSNYIEIPHSKKKLKNIANKTIFRGDYPVREKFNPFDKVTSGLDPAGVKGVDAETMTFIRDKIIPLANAKR